MSIDVRDQPAATMVEQELQGKVVIVTGASRGIGQTCAERLCAAGATVVGCSRSLENTSVPTGDPMVDRMISRTCDVSSPAEIEGVVEWTASTYGQLDCLVNNAGFHPAHTTIDNFSVEDFRELLNLNLVSMFAACKAALPHLRRTAGTIVNMGSNSGVYGQDGACTYCATKGGISSLTKALAIDEAVHGVRVNCLCPGAIMTPGTEGSVPPERLDEIMRWGWMRRLGTTAEVAEFVLFLASDRSNFMTGEDIVMNGGTHLGYGVRDDFRDHPH